MFGSITLSVVDTVADQRQRSMQLKLAAKKKTMITNLELENPVLR
jgi:hypothetical protein